jgi:ABC-2 type transport system permease protein
VNGPSKGDRASGLSAALVLATKDLKVALSYRLSFVFGHFMVFGSIVLFYFISRVVGHTAEFTGPRAYFRFAIVGMAVSAMIERSVGSAMGAARRDQVEGTLEAVASLPVSSATLGLGWLLYPLVDGLIGLAVMVFLALPLGLWGVEPNWATSLVSVALIIALFSALGLFGAALTLAFQQGSGVVSLLIAGLGLVSGALFPTTVMPQWMQTLAQASPLKHALDAMRAGVIHGASLSKASSDVLALAGFTVVLVPLSLLALELGLRRARQTGSLSRF